MCIVFLVGFDYGCVVEIVCLELVDDYWGFVFEWIDIDWFGKLISGVMGD